MSETVAKALSSICFRYPRKLAAGTLIRRYKRFLADIHLSDGREVTAHCPNSGSMLSCLEPGAPVYCSESDNPKRRTTHTWEMIRINDSWVGINTLIPNKLVAQAARKRALPLFRGVTEVETEVRIAPGTRIDLVARRVDGPLVVEVKNVTLARCDEAHFPDAVTSRGAKHLRELIRMTRAGTDCAMVYVVQRSDVRSFGPALDIDPEYGRLLGEARRAGVTICAVAAVVGPEAVCLRQELPLLI
jgi:sugar fermentation stimulation protein A